ncbi:MAG: hypothetical protein ACFFA3_03945 [Promethearchaeota archaeon]
MSKIYVCRECGYAFPVELSNLIEQNIQVYCEQCGSPFILEGVTFRPAQTPVRRKITPPVSLSKKDSTSLNKLIQFLNKISFLPIFIFTIISFGFIAELTFNFENWPNILFNRGLLGLIGLFLIIYDRAYISPKIKEEKYNEIFIDSICWGILACILYGTGVIILIKGIFIFIYVITDEQNKNLKVYHYGLLAKNSLSYLSAKAGFVIILMGIFRIYADKIYIPSSYSKTILFPIGDPPLEIPVIILIFLCYLLIAIITLSIDSRQKSELKDKVGFGIVDSIKFIIMGVLATLFYASGIFIILKGALIFFLFVGKPSENLEIPSREESPIPSPQKFTLVEPPLKPEVKQIEEAEKEPILEPTPIKTESKEEGPISEPEIKIEEEPSVIEEIEEKHIEKEKELTEEEFELRLHESLLPVKDEKDKKLVKEYFTKIFSLLSKDLRQQINDLKISKKEKRELLEELAFLTKEEQIKYVEVLIDLYKEIPKKLIERIRKLPNVKLQHIDKLIEQLKYMDSQEQIRFIQFLEENA